MLVIYDLYEVKYHIWIIKIYREPSKHTCILIKYELSTKYFRNDDSCSY